MERFIHRQYLEHYRKLLVDAKDEAQRQQILELLAKRKPRISFCPARKAPIRRGFRADEGPLRSISSKRGVARPLFRSAAEEGEDEDEEPPAIR
jgi:hypothetical protein